MNFGPHTYKVKSGRTLRSMLTKVKDTLPPGKQSNVVYRIPCSCGQVYIVETKRRLETRLKEHRDAWERGMMEKSAVTEHAWEHHHPIHWEETTVLDHGRGQKLLAKEALHIQMTPVEERFNRDGGLEVPGCWTAVMRRQGGRSNPHRPLTFNDVSSVVQIATLFRTSFTFALMTTGAFSRNVGKVIFRTQVGNRYLCSSQLRSH